MSNRDGLLTFPIRQYNETTGEYEGILPIVLREGYSYNIKNGTVIRSEMDDGLVVQRRRSSNEVRNFAISWVVDRCQLTRLQWFIREELHNGADWFILPLDFGQGLKHGRTRIIEGVYSCKNLDVDKWEVSANIEVENNKMEWANITYVQGTTYINQNTYVKGVTVLDTQVNVVSRYYTDTEVQTTITTLFQKPTFLPSETYITQSTYVVGTGSSSYATLVPTKVTTQSDIFVSTKIGTTNVSAYTRYPTKITGPSFIERPTNVNKPTKVPTQVLVSTILHHTDWTNFTKISNVNRWTCLSAYIPHYFFPYPVAMISNVTQLFSSYISSFPCYQSTKVPSYITTYYKQHTQVTSQTYYSVPSYVSGVRASYVDSYVPRLVWTNCNPPWYVELCPEILKNCTTILVNDYLTKVWSYIVDKDALKIKSFDIYGTAQISAKGSCRTADCAYLGFLVGRQCGHLVPITIQNGVNGENAPAGKNVCESTITRPLQSFVGDWCIFKNPPTTNNGAKDLGCSEENGDGSCNKTISALTYQIYFDRLDRSVCESCNVPQSMRDILYTNFQFYSFRSNYLLVCNSKDPRVDNQLPRTWDYTDVVVKSWIYRCASAQGGEPAWDASGGWLASDNIGYYQVGNEFVYKPNSASNIPSITRLTTVIPTKYGNSASSTQIADCLRAIPDCTTEVWSATVFKTLKATIYENGYNWYCCTVFVKDSYHLSPFNVTKMVNATVWKTCYTTYYSPYSTYWRKPETTPDDYMCITKWFEFLAGFSVYSSWLTTVMQKVEDPCFNTDSSSTDLQRTVIYPIEDINPIYWDSSTPETSDSQAFKLMSETRNFQGNVLQVCAIGQNALPPKTTWSNGARVYYKVVRFYVKYKGERSIKIRMHGFVGKNGNPYMEYDDDGEVIEESVIGEDGESFGWESNTASLGCMFHSGIVDVEQDDDDDTIVTKAAIFSGGGLVGTTNQLSLTEGESDDEDGQQPANIRKTVLNTLTTSQDAGYKAIVVGYYDYSAQGASVSIAYTPYETIKALNLFRLLNWNIFVESVTILKGHKGGSTGEGTVGEWTTYFLKATGLPVKISYLPANSNESWCSYDGLYRDVGGYSGKHSVVVFSKYFMFTDHNYNFHSYERVFVPKFKEERTQYLAFKTTWKVRPFHEVDVDYFVHTRDDFTRLWTTSVLKISYYFQDSAYKKPKWTDYLCDKTTADGVTKVTNIVNIPTTTSVNGWTDGWTITQSDIRTDILVRTNVSLDTFYSSNYTTNYPTYVLKTTQIKTSDTYVLGSIRVPTSLDTIIVNKIVNTTYVTKWKRQPVETFLAGNVPTTLNTYVPVPVEICLTPDQYSNPTYFDPDVTIGKSPEAQGIIEEPNLNVD